ncbi:MAG TPA: bis(5'-nucleosyl)-tetraphosphatase (symmetrical) YqeK [Spirochaetia bacterium]|nr:bis(5'-nucleosyl)-tetraphosphatase (symmetrical) YqeK [Spirochaetia bacterium]
MHIFPKTNSMLSDLPLADATEFLKQNVSRRRFIHSLRVAETARGLAEHHGEDASHSYFAGLCHDFAREWTESSLMETASRDGKPFSSLELQRPMLLHGRAAAVILSEQFSFSLHSVLDAIRYHTLGIPGIGGVGKILYIADYIEPGRNAISSQFRAQISGYSLNEAVLAVIDHAVGHGKKIAEMTQAMYDELRMGYVSGETSKI